MSVPVRGDNKDVTIYRQVFAIAAAHVQTDGAGFKSFQKPFNDWPWLKCVLKYAHCYSLLLKHSFDVLYTALTKNVKQFARRLCGRALLRRPRPLFVQTWQCL
jgi:hypothetical protein